jgi:hypothetical protein
VAKKNSESLAPTTARADETRRGTFQRKIKKTDAVKESAETAAASEDASNATVRAGCILLPLTAVDYPGAARQKVAV